MAGHWPVTYFAIRPATSRKLSDQPAGQNLVGAVLVGTEVETKSRQNNIQYLYTPLENTEITYKSSSHGRKTTQ